VFPAGRPLSLELTSDTVMNSLFIPALGGQIYAMAGMRTELNLLSDHPGRFMGRNTQFSGNGFAAQQFSADAVDAVGFEAFLTEARTSSVVLDRATFGMIAKPTIAGPQKLFSSVEPGLFETILAAHGSMPAMAPTAAPHAEHTP
jgi:cytochrome o ubiquinol oxidase subunit 2